MAKVPVSKDGSRFEVRTCRRGNGYWIGPKGNQKKIESFEDALAALTRMVPPRWTRRTPIGHWGVVVGVTWEP